MAQWNRQKVDPSQINGGQEYSLKDNLSIEALNAILNNSFYASDLILKLQDGDLTELATIIRENTYRVGDICITLNTISPADYFGGIWEQIKDCFLWANGDTQSITYTENEQQVTKSLNVNERGGEIYHKLTIEEMPRHSHKYERTTYNTSYSDWATGPNGYQMELDTSSVGGGQPHNNMPPYLSVKMWKRVG